MPGINRLLLRRSRPLSAAVGRSRPLSAAIGRPRPPSAAVGTSSRVRSSVGLEAEPFAAAVAARSNRGPRARRCWRYRAFAAHLPLLNLAAVEYVRHLDEGRCRSWRLTWNLSARITTRPANCLVNDRGVVKLADFGASQHLAAASVSEGGASGGGDARGGGDGRLHGTSTAIPPRVQSHHTHSGSRHTRSYQVVSGRITLTPALATRGRMTTPAPPPWRHIMPHAGAPTGAPCCPETPALLGAHH